MTIYWDPVEDDLNPDTIDIWHVQEDGTQTEIGPADVSGVDGMPDSVGGIAPDAVREEAADYFINETTPGNSPSLNNPSTESVRDMLALNYERGTPP